MDIYRDLIYYFDVSDTFYRDNLAVKNYCFLGRNSSSNFSNLKYQKKKIMLGT